MLISIFAQFLRRLKGVQVKPRRGARWTEQGAAEILEDRTLLTISITTNTIWDTNAKATLTDNVVVSNGATLTIASGVNMTATGNYTLTIGSGTAATLIADSASFQSNVLIDAKGTASLTNNHFTGGVLSVNPGATLSSFTTNDFHGAGAAMTVYPEFVPQIGATNSFGLSATINIAAGNVTHDTTWRNIPNATYTLLGGGVTVNGGATLTIASGAALSPQFSSTALTVGTATAGTLVADNVSFRINVELDAKSTATLTHNHFTSGTLTIDAGAVVPTFTTNDFHSGSTPLTVTPEFVPQIAASNTFGLNSTVGISAAGITHDTTWRTIPNASYFLLGGGVDVNGGATLTIASGATLLPQFSSTAVTVGTGTFGALIANNVTFQTNVEIDAKGTASLIGNHFTAGKLTIDSGSTLSSFTSNEFHGAGSPLTVYPEFVPQIGPTNTFGLNSSILITAEGMTHDTTWRNIPNATYEMLGSGVTVNAGATLTIGSGVLIVPQFSSTTLTVGTGTAGGLVASNVSFQIRLEIDTKGTAALTGNHIIGGILTIDPGATLSTFTSNDFHTSGSSSLVVYPEFVPQIPASNTFGPDSTFSISTGSIVRDTTWSNFPNVTYLLLSTGVTVSNNATLTIANGVLLTPMFSSTTLTVGAAGSPGGLVTRGASLGTKVSLTAFSFGEIYESSLSSTLTIDSQSPVVIRDNYFTAGTIVATGDNTRTLDLSQNFYGTTNTASIETNRITDKDDSASRPQITVTNPIPQNTLSGTVWFDANGNGIQDRGEQFVSNVTVTLKDAGLDVTSGTGDDTTVGSTTTDANGRYTFSGLVQNKRYFVEFTAPAGKTFTLANQTDDRNDSDASPSTGRTDVLGGWFDGAFDPAWDAGLRNVIPTAPEIAASTPGGISLLDGVSTIDFGSTPQGTNVPRTIVITNNGDANLILQPASVPVGSAYTFVSNFIANQVLAPGASTSLIIRLNAGSSGTFTSQLTIANNDADENPFNLTLTGNVDPVPAPEIAARDSRGFNIADNTGDLDFGSTPFGVPVSQTITITNTGDANLVLQPATVGAGFSILSNFSAGQTLTPGGTATLTVQMNGTTSGNLSAVVGFNTNDTDEDHFNFNVLGYVEPVPATEVSVRELNGLNIRDALGFLYFGSTPLNTTVTKTIVVSNDGTAPLILQPATVGAGFTVVTNFTAGQQLAPGATANLVIRLDATGSGYSTATLAFDNNDSNEGHFDFTLQGYVEAAPGPEIGVRESNGGNVGDNLGLSNFGSTPIGVTVTKTYVVTNYGTADLVLQPATVGNGFTIVTNLAANTTLAPGASANLVVRFDAASLGSISTTLAFTNNDSDEGNYDFTIGGFVEPPPAPEVSVREFGGFGLQDGSGALFFDTTVVGAPETRTIVVTNLGNANLILQPATIGAGFSIPTNFTAGQVLTPGSSATLLLQLDATTAGNYSSTLTFANNDSDEGTFDLAVNGAVQTAPVPSPHILLRELNGPGIANTLGAVDFGLTLLGTPASRTLVITNTGNADLVLQPATVTAGFSIASNFSATTLAPGATATVVVRLDAVALGATTGTLSFDSNDPNQSHFAFAVRGYVSPVPAPQVVIQGPSGSSIGNGTGFLEFGQTVVGTVINQSIIINNSGNADLIVQPAVVGAGYTIINNFVANQHIAPGASVTLIVRINANVSGSVSSNLSFDTNDANAPHYVFGLQGFVAPIPAAQTAVLDAQGNPIQSGSGLLTFVPTAFGTTVNQTIVINNPGNTDLILQPATVGAGYSITSNFTANQHVAPGASAALVVVMNANVSGHVASTLTFDTNDAQTPHYTFALQGYVAPPPTPVVTLLDPSGNPILSGTGVLNFAATPHGTAVSQTLVITNSGNSVLVLQPATVGAGFVIQSNFTVNQQVAPGTSVSLVVLVDANTSGNVSGTLAFNTNDANTPHYQFALHGYVAPPPAPVVSIVDANGNAILSGSGSVAFGSTTHGASVSQTISITNTGNSVLIVQPATIGAGFTIQSNFAVNQQVAPGATVNLVVVINTSVNGNVSSTLAFNTNDVHTPHYTFALQGYVAPAPAPAINILDAHGNPVSSGTGIVNFGPVGFGANATQTIVITNSGNTTLVVQPATVGAGFSITTNFAVNQQIAPGASFNLVVALNSNAVGSVTSTLAFNTNDPATPHFTFALAGTVSASPLPAASLLNASGNLLSATSGAVDFGAAVFGGAVSQTLTIKNSGNAPLILQPATVGAGFSITTNFAANQQVAPGASATLVIVLNTNVAGDASATLAFNTNDAVGSHYTIALRGHTSPAPAAHILVLDGLGATVSNHTGIVNFGAVTQLSAQSQTITIRNSGNTALILQPATVTGTGFSITTNFTQNQSVAPGASATLVIALDTTLSGPFQGTLTLNNSDATAGPFVFNLAGSVSPIPAPEILATVLNGPAIDTGSGVLNLGPTTVGSAVTRTVVITNAGNADLVLQPATATGTGFTITTNFTAGQIVHPGASANLIIRLDGTAPGTSTGTVSFASNSGVTPFGFALLGQVIPAPSAQIAVTLQNGPSITDGSAAVAFDSTTVGTAVTKTFVVTNTGTAPLVLQPASIPGNAFTIVSNFAVGQTVLPGASATLVVRFNATATGSFSSTLTFVNSDSVANPFNFGLTGQVNPAPAPEVSVALLDGPSLTDHVGVVSVGPTTVGSPVTQTIVVTNTGSANLILQPASLSGIGFTIVGNFTTNQIVLPGASANLVVRLNATATGAITGDLHFITSDADEGVFDIALNGNVTPAPAPDLVFEDQSGAEIANHATLELGLTTQGVPVTRTIVIANTGTADLTLQPATFGGSGFSLVTNVPSNLVLHPGASTTLVIRQDATATGRFSGTLSIANTGVGTNPFAFSLVGDVAPIAAPEILVRLADGPVIPNQVGEVDFDSTLLGTPVIRSIVITNAGNSNLTLQPATLGGAGFTILTNLTANLVLTPGASTNLVVQLDAATAGNFTNDLTFSNTDADEGQYHITVSGVVTPLTSPVLAVQELNGPALQDGVSTVEFGNTTSGTAVTKTIVVTNHGTAPLVLQPAQLAGPGFTILTNFTSNQTLAPGQSANLQIQLDAVGAGTPSAAITFASNDVNQPQFDFTLHGSVTATPIPLASVAEKDGPPISAQGGTVALGSTGKNKLLTKVIVITNAGTAPLTVQNAQLNGASAALTIGSNVTSSGTSRVLQPGQSTTIVLHLLSKKLLTVDSQLTFTTSDPQHSAYSIHITGAVAKVKRSTTPRTHGRHV